jgi:CheY-like chemotaxis protein
VALERAMDAAGVAPQPAAPAGPSEPRHGELLVVDDSRTVRERHRAILTAVGYHVRTAADGAEALGLLAERSADAVITDLDMPGMDGLRLTTEIRQRPELSSPAILVVTSRGDAKTRDRLLGAGADAFLPKDDTDADRLLAQLAGLLADAS